MTDPAAPVGLPKDTTHFPGDDCDPPHLDMSTAAAPVGLDLDRLGELLAKADALPWFTSGTAINSPVHSTLAQTWPAGSDPTFDAAITNAELVVAAVNALPALLDLVSRQQGALRRALKRLPDICEHIIFDEAGDEHHYVYCEGCGAHELPHGMPPDKTDACWAETERIALRSLLPREPKT